jgi:polyisoprenoid-binding protein YceI
VVFRVVPDQSEARYRVREQLANLQFPSDAVGRTKAISGTVAFASDGSIVSSASKLTVDLTTLQSNEQRRDNFIKSNTLEVSRYPAAEFVPREARGLPWPLPASGEATFQLVGDMTIHGTTRPVTWDVTAKFAGDQVTGTATTSFKFGDFNMQVPRVAVVLSVEDNIRLEVDFTFARIAT